MDNTFLANLQHEGDPVNLDQVNAEEGAKETPVEKETPVKETPATPPVEEKPKEGASASPAEGEKGTPPEKSEEPAVYHAFHEHPRFQALVREREQDKELISELQAFKEKAEPILEGIIKPKDEAIPQEFSVLFGNDEGAWRNYQSLTERQQKAFIEKLDERLKPILETAERTKKQTELEAWADSEWKSLKEDQIVQGELKKLGKNFDESVQDSISQVITKYLPTDEKTGNLSVRKGYELWRELNSKSPVTPNPATDEKKKVAAMTTEKSNATEEKKDYRTSADFKGKSFADFR